MRDDLEDLLGPEPAPEDEPEDEPEDAPEDEPEDAPEDAPEDEPGASRPGKPKRPSGRADATVVQRLYQPVSISFLADVLNKDRKTVTKRLANLPPVGQHRGNVPLYDFRQAVELLVQPRLDQRAIEKALKSMSADDLPPSLQKDVWDAKLKAQKWMVNAGELWRTEDVLEVLSEAFQRLKTTTQLWIDQVGDHHALSDAARKDLTELVDALQTDLHRTLVEMPKQKATRPQLSEIEDADG